jgi:hypothetical protein
MVPAFFFNSQASLGRESGGRFVDLAGWNSLAEDVKTVTAGMRSMEAQIVFVPQDVQNGRVATNDAGVWKILFQHVSLPENCA